MSTLNNLQPPAHHSGPFVFHHDAGQVNTNGSFGNVPSAHPQLVFILIIYRNINKPRVPSKLVERIIALMIANSSTNTL